MPNLGVTLHGFFILYIFLYSFLDQLRWQLPFNPNEEQRRALKFETIFDLSFIFDRIRYQLFSLFFPTRSFCSPISTFFSLSTSWIMWLYWKTLFKTTAKKSKSFFAKKKKREKVKSTLLCGVFIRYLRIVMFLLLSFGSWT